MIHQRTKGFSVMSQLLCDSSLSLLKKKKGKEKNSWSSIITISIEIRRSNIFSLIICDSVLGFEHFPFTFNW